MGLLIPPEIGRTLYFHANGAQPHAARAGAGGPLAAKIVHVHSDRMINVVVWNANGESFGVTSVTLVHPEDATEDHAGFFCAWMPWQVEQAERALRFKQAQEAMRSRLEKASADGACQVKKACEGAKEAEFATPAEVKAPTLDELTKLADEHGTPVRVSACGGVEGSDAHVAAAKGLEEAKGERLPPDPLVEGPKNADPRPDPKLDDTLPGPGAEAPKGDNKFGLWGKK